MTLSQSLQSASLTDPGRVRDHNEDCIESRPDIGLYVLADGMGGYNAGEVASGMATSLISDGLQESWNPRESERLGRDQAKADTERLLAEQIARANNAIFTTSQNKNLVTRALGIDPTVEPEIHVYETQVGDSYLLCSDGLSDMVEDEEIRLTLLTLRSNPNLTVQQLVQAANDNGGRDNISAVLIRVAEPFGVPRGWVARLKALFR